MRILHFIPGLGRSAGTSTFCGEVCNQLSELGHDVTIAVCNNDKDGDFIVNQGVRIVSLNYLLSENNQSIDCSFSVVHIHGFWEPVFHRVASWAKRNDVPIVWSTHGMTAPWSLHHKWWKKILPWNLYIKRNLKRAALIHCTTDLESDWNKALGFTNTFIAPLGTNLPEGKNSAVDLHLQPTPKQQRTLLYVGRIYPVKALDNAIRAVALMKQPITLRLVGPDQSGHMSELMTLCDSLGLPYTKPGEDNSALHLQPTPTPKQVQFIGPKYDSDLDNEYWTCGALILVSHTENFGATVIDAMAHGKPVITSTKTPWKIVADKGCGWWVDNSPESLAKTFDTFSSTSTSDLNLLGQRGLALVKQSYTWPAIAKNLVSNYERVIHA